MRCDRALPPRSEWTCDYKQQVWRGRDGSVPSVKDIVACESEAEQAATSSDFGLFYNFVDFWIFGTLH